jgi:hypothetical protein
VISSWLLDYAEHFNYLAAAGTFEVQEGAKKFPR